MRLDELINAPDLLVYHWTNGEGLYRILETNRLDGDTSHTLEGRRVTGVSLTRDRSLSLHKTYVVAGRKPFRLGLRYQKLRQSHRVIPIRDDYLRVHHKARQFPDPIKSLPYLGSGYTLTSDSNEAEEFLIGSLSPLLPYLAEIACRSGDFDEEENDDSLNLQCYQDIYFGTYGESHDGYEPHRQIHLPPSVRFVEIDIEQPHYSTEVDADSPRFGKRQRDEHENLVDPERPVAWDPDEWVRRFRS